jgi:ion channel-forming bestrophin family protein
MYIKRNYGFLMTFRWSAKPFYLGMGYAALVVSADYLAPQPLSLPWQPVSIIGIAVAFYLGFKNNSSYDRTWEARKIWGAIVNDSRTFATAVLTMVKGPEAKAHHQRLIYRHIAWLTALRYQLRLSRPWEHTAERLDNLYIKEICGEYFDALHRDLEGLLPPDELYTYMGQANMASQLLRKQAEELAALAEAGHLTEYRHVWLHQLISRHFDEQGKSERIKNFPFPRQYASTALWTTWVFCALVPFGMLDIFTSHTAGWYWLSIPFSALTTWIFFLMEKIGDYSENPFEGTYNDVPITSIARTIEIDLREMLRETNVPEPVKDENGFLL